MFEGNRPWVGLSHAGVVKAVCVDKRQLQFTDSTPECIQLLSQACMSYDPAGRPSFKDIVDVIQPVYTSLMSQ